MKRNSQKGISLVEMLITVGLIGGAAYIVYNSASIYNRMSSRAQASLDISEVSFDVLHRSKEVLFNTYDSNGNRTQGVCEIVEKGPGSSPPVGTIHARMSDLGDVVNVNRLDNILSDWQPVADSDCNQDSFEFCFELKQGSSYSEVVESMNPKLKLTITPLSMLPSNLAETLEKESIFAPIDIESVDEEIDVKHISFLFESIISAEIEDGSFREFNSRSMEWLPTVGNCEKLSTLTDESGNDYIYTELLSLTGMELVTMPNLGNVIINNPGFRDESDALPVDFIPRRIVAQVGTRSESGQSLFTDQSQNIITSCNEIYYTCPNRSSNKRIYEGISLVGNLRHVFPNRVQPPGNPVPLSVKVKNEIRRDGQALQNLDFYGARVSGTTGACHVQTRADGIVDDDCIKREFLEGSLITSMRLSMTLMDQGQQRANNACRQICQDSNNYNASSSVSNYASYLSFDYPDFPGNEHSLQVASRVGCTACYMKNCDQFGLGTFGPMTDMPYQPLDAGIPLCAEFDQTSTISSVAQLLKNSVNNTSGQDCVMGRYNQFTNNIDLHFEDCSKTLPVMCFAFGGPKLARDLTQTTSSLASVRHEDAADRCVRMGREVVSIGQLDEYLAGFSPSNTSGGNYDFINLAQQGSFFAHQTQSDIDSFRDWLDEEGLNSPASGFWVGLGRDAERLVTSRVPVISPEVDDYIDAIYFSGAGRLVSFPIDHVISGSSPSGGNDWYGVLLHNVKYKGVKPMRGNNPLSGEEMPFICRQKNTGGGSEFFLSDDSSNQINDGKQICNDEGGIFLPPVTPYEWVVAMTLVEPISREHPFPRIQDSYDADAEEFNFKKAWVAVAFDSSTSSVDRLRGVNWKLPSFMTSNSDVFNSSAFTPQFSGSGKHNGVMLDGSQSFQNPFSRISIGADVSISSSRSFSIRVSGFDECSFTVQGPVPDPDNPGATKHISASYLQTAFESNCGGNVSTYGLVSSTEGNELVLRSNDYKSSIVSQSIPSPFSLDTSKRTINYSKACLQMSPLRLLAQNNCSSNAIELKWSDVKRNGKWSNLVSHLLLLEKDNLSGEKIIFDNE